MIEDLPWMYYGRFRTFLGELNHHFKEKIDFVVDEKMNIEFSILEKYAVVIFYYRDPLQELYPRAYQYAKRIEDFCFEKGIIFLNRTDPLSKTTKSLQLYLLEKSGYRVAKRFPFNSLEELKTIPAEYYPIFIRSNAGHDSDNLTIQGLFFNEEEVCKKYMHKTYNSPHLRGHVAIQWIDARNIEDGLYRRYRIFATRKQAITGNVMISKDWYIHGINSLKNSSSFEENQQYKMKDLTAKEQNFFTGINMSLDLDFCAIDFGYSLDSGEIIVWEANPHPAFSTWWDEEAISKRKLTELLVNYYNDILENL